MTQQKVNCEVCNKEFLQYSPIQKYCSSKCGYKINYLKQYPKIEKVCPICKTKFLVSGKKQKVCGLNNCKKMFYKKTYLLRYSKNNPRMNKQCLICNKEFESGYKRQKICSRIECKLEFYRVGSKQYSREHRDERIVYCRQYYIKNKEERLIKQRAYRNKNSKDVKESDKRTYYKYKKHRDIPPYGSLEHLRKLQEPKSTNGYFKKYLSLLNYYFISEFIPFISNRKFRADFFIPSLNLCIDINSNYWHDYNRFPEKEKEDLEKPIHFRSLGYDFLVIRENDLKKFKI